jgi:phasin family protein
MQESFIKAYSDQVMKQYQSMIQLNSFWLTNLEKGIDLQLDALNEYSHITLEQAKNIADFKSFEDLERFHERSSKVSDSLNKRLLKDNKQLTDMTHEMTKDLVSDAENIWQIL